MNRRHMKAYFGQGLQYFSESKGELFVIATMNSRHAANAARRLARECDFWAKEAGVDHAAADLWLTTTALYQALARRGMVA